MNRYGAGRRLEWKVRKRLEGAGWFVIRSAGSKGPCDLVAFQRDRVLFVQCKRGRFSKAAWSALVATADAYDAIPLCADPDGLWSLGTWPQKWMFDGG